MSLKIARQIFELIQQDKEVEIRETLDPYSLEQRQCIMSIQHNHSSLLSMAVANKLVSIVTYFLESCGADPNSFGWRNGVKLSCLAVATDVNSEKIVGILLTHGANTEVVSSYGTPLKSAFCNNRENIIRLLIKHGANVNLLGQIPVTMLLYNFSLFRLLISKGADINSVDNFSQTVLMMSCKTEEYEIIYFLLSCENIDVRVRNNYGQDALHLAVRHCSEDIVKAIISKGVYTNDEIIEVHELESCLSHVQNRKVKARELWQETLRLRSQPSDTPIFENQHPTGKLRKVVDLLNDDDVSALLYLESVHGLNNVFTLGVYIRAACNVNDKYKYLTLCKFFLDALHSGEDRLFFKGISQSVKLIQHYLIEIFYRDLDLLNLSKIFRLFVPFIEEIRLRLEHMTPRERMPHAYKVKYLLKWIIEMVGKIDEEEKMNLFHEGIKRILMTGLPALLLKSLIRIWAYSRHPDCIIRCFIRCGADVNSINKEGKSELHEVVEYKVFYRKEFVKNIINNGFDFSRVRCNEYCLPCRLEREHIIPHPVKHISLQCLAARSLCEKTMNCFSDVPRYVRTIVNSHLFLI